MELENRVIRIEIQEGGAGFDILPQKSGHPGLKTNQLRITGGDLHGRPFTFSPRLSRAEAETGMDGSWFFTGVDVASGLEWRVIFQATGKEPFIFWKVEIKNHSLRALRIEKITLLEPAENNSRNVIFDDQADVSRLAFFSNGWQSWSSSGAYAAGSRQRHSRLGILQNPMVINPGTPAFRSRGLFSSDFFGVLGDRQSRSGLLLGFLSQKNHFGSLTADLRREACLRLWANGDHTHLPPGASMSTDWAVCALMDIDDPQAMTDYYDIVACEHGIKSLPAAQAGWCSWYYYYEKISEGIISENLEKIDGLRERLPLNLVQIDDGFEAQVGDWLETNAGFSDGMAPLAQRIRESGFTPGLWLAPFILHPDSRTAVENPQWILKRADGRPARAGFGWNSLTIALDLTVPEALEYACQAVETATHQWGYQYLKLDFLYAAALKCVYHDPTRTRAQVLRGGMQALRRSAGADTTLLGCGLPLGAGLGLVEAMRIGADVSGSWKPSYFGMGFPFRKEPHMPCARNSIQNILVRAGMHNRWWVNDPDCLLVRPDSRLNLEEVRTLATAIGMTGGSVLLSDNMNELPEDRLEMVAALLPPVKKAVQVIDWLDEETPRKLKLDLRAAAGDWCVLAYFNWRDKADDCSLSAADFRLPEGAYWVRSFWDQRVWKALEGGALYQGRLAAHAALVLAVRPYKEKQAAYLGSSLHISQGLEVSGWQSGRNALEIQFSPGRQAMAGVDVYIPVNVREAFFDGKPADWKKMDAGVHRFSLEMARQNNLTIKY